MNLRLIREEAEPPVTQESAMSWVVRIWILVSTTAAAAFAAGFIVHHIVTQGIFK
jgi:hypothetical protein